MNSQETGKPEDISTELLIIGGGGAGLAAAVTAAQKGLSKIIVLEKRGVTGGNTTMSSGLFAAESPAQKRDAIDARSEHFFKILMEFSHWKANPRIVRAFIDKSADTIRWLEKMGLFFKALPMYPNQIPTWHQARGGRGAEMVKVLTEQCHRLGVKILTNTSAKKIIKGDKGNVTGVVAEYKGDEFIINCERIIIATGGYGGNKELVKKYCPSYRDNMLCDGLLHEGDGLIMAMEAGAANEGLGLLLMSGPQIPGSINLFWDDPPNIKVSPLMAIALEPNTVWVNKLGERIADEAVGYNHYTSANTVNRQPDNLCFTLLDKKIVKTMEKEGLFIGLGPFRPEMRDKMPGLERELRKQTQGLMTVEQVDREICNGCATCVSACPVGAITMDTIVEDRNESSPCRLACPAGMDMRIIPRAVINYVDDCRMCKSCENSCPVNAIYPKPVRKVEPHVKISDSWEEIAEWMGADPIVLKRTIEEYNVSCDRGYDPVFSKDRRYLVPLRTPPFYAIKSNSDYLDTIGGIKINERMEVLDRRGRPIPGLYAAGVVAGGWQGDTYCVVLSGAASGFAVNSGRIAAENAIT